MLSWRKISFIILTGLSLVISSCGGGQTDTPTPTSTDTSTPTNTSTFTATYTPTYTFTPTFTFTPTETDTETLTPTITVGTIYPTFTPTTGTINLPGLGGTCTPNGQISCSTMSQNIPLLGTCSVTVCTDSCGNVTSQSTGSCH
jgi:hypothetical protein